MPAQRLAVRQGQALALTPRLRQAIALLGLSNAELAAYVERELLENPLLERAEGEGRDGGPAAPPRAGHRARPFPAAPNGKVGRAVRTAPAASGGDSLTAIESAVAAPMALRDYLHSQLAIEIADRRGRRIGRQLIEALDEAGYLTAPLAEIAAAAGCPLGAVEATLARLQRFDPPGVFARDLGECLALQLRDRGRLDPPMQALLGRLDLLARRDLAGLMRHCGVGAEALAAMIGEIRRLDPKPGLAFDAAPLATVVPDLLVEREGDGWTVALNPATLPRLLVDRSAALRLRAGAADRAGRAYVTERLDSANWLLRALDQRARTLLTVAREILRRQEPFLAEGAAGLRPLTRRAVAAAVGLHESTVGRATRSKYVATPQGVHPLGYFFTAALAGADGEERHAAEAVRRRIRQLIAAEGPGEALSDARLAGLLRGEGVAVARRTIAKYRESLQIPGSAQRRRDKSLRI